MREESPDWVRSFQAPTLTLSSDSDPLPYDSPSPSKPTSEASNHSVWTLSSDSEAFPDNSSKREPKNSKLKRTKKDKAATGGISKGSPSKKASKKEKSPKKQVPKKENSKIDDLQETGDHVDFEVADEDATEKHTSSQGASSRIPLLLSEKVNRSKALVECDGESIDLSGDVGAVGRVVIPNASSGNHEMFFDLKGTIYRTTIIPSRTFCVVSFGQSEAKIEAIMNDFIQLKAHSNVYEAETMVEGTLEGFSFDSEDEAEKMPKAGPDQTDQNEGNEEKSNGKTKRKAEKSSGKAQKKGRSGGKPPPAKKATKATKKAKTKK
ncbi:double-stranded DNA binding [Euphorbia peplus]|nr:double-stranded DNA binding [Euphorbia peplus]